MIGGYYYEKSVASAFAVVTSPNWGAYVGLRYNNWASADFGYVAGYTSALTPRNLYDLYNATKNRYP